MRMLESIPNTFTCPIWNYVQIFIFVATGSKEHVLETGMLMRMLELFPNSFTCLNLDHVQIFFFVTRFKEHVLEIGKINANVRIDS